MYTMGGGEYQALEMCLINGLYCKSKHAIFLQWVANDFLGS